MAYVLPLLAILGVHLLAVASPGPAFIATVQLSVSQTRRVALMQAFGLGLAAFTWACAALLGMQAVMLKAAGLYRLLEFAGGVYLAYIGIQAWRHADDPLAMDAAQAPAMSSWAALRRGYATNISNPKVMVFFASIFAAMLPPSMPTWTRLVALGFVGLDEGLWFTLLALMFSTERAQEAYRRAKRKIDRAAGTFMLFFGGKLMWSATR